MNAPVTTARANVNLALVKYWGKRDTALNLPAAGSISLTLDGLSVEARVGFDGGAADRVEIDGAPASDGAGARARSFLEDVRAEAGGRHDAAVSPRPPDP